MSCYKNPPIIEAICELHFVPESEWDPTLSGKLHAELLDDYPGKPRYQKSIEFGAQFRENSLSNLPFGKGAEIVQLITANQKRIVGVGRDVLSVHMLAPYHDPQNPDKVGWAEFQQRIGRALGVYWDVVQPQGAKRIGIRHINKLAVPEELTSVEEYLRCALPTVNGLPDNLLNLMSQVEYAYPDGVKLRLSQGKVRDGFILDIDLIKESTDAFTWESADGLMDDLRTREREVLETIITDKARTLPNAP